MSAIRQDVKEIGASEALEILGSALANCQRAGLAVCGGNANGGATIVLPGVTINEGRLELASAVPET